MLGGRIYAFELAISQLAWMQLERSTHSIHMTSGITLNRGYGIIR